MNHDQIKKPIEQNISDAHLDVAELRVQPDPFRGWRIAVVSADFTRKSHFERKDIALAGLSVDGIGYYPFPSLSRGDRNLGGNRVRSLNLGRF